MSNDPCGLNGHFREVRDYQEWRMMDADQKDREIFGLLTEASRQLQRVGNHLESMEANREKVNRRDKLLVILAVAIFLEIGATKLLPILLEAKLFAPLIGG